MLQHCCCPLTSPTACVPLSHCCHRLELAPRPSLSVPSTRAFVWNVTNRSSDNLAFWCGSMRRRIDEWRNRFQRGGGPLSSCGFQPGRIILQGFAEESIIHTPESFMRYLSSSSWTVQFRQARVTFSLWVRGRSCFQPGKPNANAEVGEGCFKSCFAFFTQQHVL